MANYAEILKPFAAFARFAKFALEIITSSRPPPRFLSPLLRPRYRSAHIVPMVFREREWEKGDSLQGNQCTKATCATFFGAVGEPVVRITGCTDFGGLNLLHPSLL